MIIKALARLDEQVDRVKTKINTVGPMRPGSLSVQRRRDRDKKLYGAYWHLTWTAQGKVYTQYIPKCLLNQMRMETRNYRRFRQLVDRLVTLSIKRSRQVMAATKSPAEAK